MAVRDRPWIDALWYGRSTLSLVLLPLAWLFGLVVALRRFAYRYGLRRSTRLATPVVVIGNITVGGTGKTPVTIALVNALRARGLRAGVVSRGYGGLAGESPLPVLAHSDPAVTGDEPVVVAERCHCPVVVHPDRVAAGRLLEEQGVDVIVADDGLQHYRLRRDLEIAIVDAARGFGNGRLLPAGPLREPVSRLRSVEQVLVNRLPAAESAGLPLAGVPVTGFHLEPQALHRLGGDATRSLGDLAGKRVHGVAAIGNPQRFFDLLRAHDIDVIAHPLPDHAALHAQDFAFGDGLPVVITEKDAVKCRHIETAEIWYLPVDAVFDDQDWIDAVERMIRAYTPPDDD